MKKLNIECSSFKVVRELNIAGERTICEYLNRFQLHDIKEFVSAYYITNSTDESYRGKIIIGHERWDNDADAIQEQFHFAPDSVYEGQNWVLVHSDIDQIAWNYFKEKYTEKTGLTDYDNLFMESDDGCCGELVPEYDEDKYMSRRFFKPLEVKAA